ncbi:Metallo-hydrolase/oxidoreductase superfamily protein [Euphorbia peplus]|nr:Metallo-hydrolase/oxidoreductase superfamily protein [Euphorbia peplus]
MAVYNLALILKNEAEEFLVVKQTPPPKFGDEEYDSFVDSHLWDFPSTKLHLLQPEYHPTILIEAPESLSGNITFKKYDFDSAIKLALEQVGIKAADAPDWTFFKFVEEPDFGPAFSIHTIYVTGKLASRIDNSPELCKWMSRESCLNLLLDVKPNDDRVGPLVVLGVINDSLQISKQNVDTTLRRQEYPPGVTLVPMRSRTQKPFKTTNLVIFAPQNVLDTQDCSNFVACGDALIVDPGCIPDFHDELFKIVAALPRNLVVFITHHHHDHVDGLSIIQKCNPGATLLAHENTMRRVGKDDWSLGYTSVSGGEDICIGGQKLKVIFAPGHTDGHVGLLHVSTHSLIVGDHCLGQGSAVLDITSGGNMTDYFQSTYNFIELAPHALIPMHGRVNIWPKHLLCAYLKNRRSRETTILKAIENGAKSLFDIVASVYCDVDRSLWISASSNVQLHVDHLAQQNKLPQEFSIQKFKRSCRLHFLGRWMWAYLTDRFHSRCNKLSLPKLLVAGAVGAAAVFYSINTKLISNNKE